MTIALSNKKKAWVLHQCQAAAFYQTENWEALYEIERLLGDDGADWCVVETCSELEPKFLNRNLYESDLNLFLAGLHHFDDKNRRFALSLTKETKARLLTQLRKMNWTYGELLRIAHAIAPAVGEKDSESIRYQFSELANCSGEGYELTMEDVDEFVLEKIPSGV